MNSSLTKLVQSAAKTIQDQEKLAVPLLTIKLNKLAETHPFDQTIVMVADIVAKAYDKNKLFITRSELKDLYQRLYSRNTKFAEYFGDELGKLENLSAPKMYEKHEAPIDTSVGTNVVLSNAFQNAIDKTVPLQPYSKDQADKALSYVNAALDGWNIKSSKLTVANGNQQFILVKADYETPKGLASVLVPVEIKGSKMLEPSVFLSQGALKELNHNNVKAHILSAIEQKIASKSYGTDVKMPKPAQLDTFAEKFKSPMGVATFKFGADKVDLGRDAVVRCLVNLGMNHPQIGVVAAEDTTVVYGVSMGKIAFKVPVKFANNKVMTPELMICNGSVMPLNKANVNHLFVKNETDYGVAASVSALHGLKASDLIQTVKDAAAEQNYAQAEEALNVLQQSGDEAGYKVALEAYMGGLTMKKTAEKQVACSMVIKSASSQHPVCGHTGLPVHKVYQDEHGNCHPMYRKNIAPQTDSVLFNNSKIFG